MDQFVEPSAINYYRLHPNYFFQSGGFVRVQGRGQGQMAVCSSRSVERPRFSNTSLADNVNCVQLQPSKNFDFDVSNACEGHYLIQHCAPLYISVEGILVAAGENGRCVDPECRTPDSIKYGLVVENLGCYSTADQLFNCHIKSILLLSSSILVFIFQ